MSSKKPVITKRRLKPSNIDLDVWTEETLKRFPITAQHIGGMVKYASNPRSKNYTLLEIKEPGDEYFPEGGYVLSDKDTMYDLRVFTDEIIPYRKRRAKRKKKKSNSQLARKSKKKKSKKKKKKK